MVWYISNLSFETNEDNLNELEEKLLDGENIRGSLDCLASEGGVYLVEKKGSSFLRQAEDYIISLNSPDPEVDRAFWDGDNYAFEIYVASTNPETKREVMEKAKNYLSSRGIEFKEENE